jgi:dihydroflavonol-4-reductase
MSTFKTALVTGGAGFIGRHLVDLLIKKGCRVTVLDPTAIPSMFPKGVSVIKGSILDDKALTKSLIGVEVVFHLAALTHLWAKDKKEFERINVEGTAAVLKAAKEAEVAKIVVTSTETVLRSWANTNPFPITEQEPIPDLADMAGPYTRSKLKAANLVRTAAKEGLPVVQVFPTVPVGEGDYGLTAPTKMILGFVEKKTPAYFNALLNFVTVEDVAEGHYLAAERGMLGEEFILGGENLAMFRFLEMLGDVSGVEMPKRQVAYLLAALTGVLAEFFADFITRRPPIASKEAVRLALNSAFVTTHAAEKRLGYVPGSIKPALKKTVNWFKKVNLI